MESQQMTSHLCPSKLCTEQGGGEVDEEDEEGQRDEQLSKDWVTPASSSCHEASFQMQAAS
eukprot:8608602-Prorocentrum_lima.AAC.1